MTVARCVVRLLLTLRAFMDWNKDMPPAIIRLSSSAQAYGGSDAEKLTCYRWPLADK